MSPNINLNTNMGSEAISEHRVSIQWTPHFKQKFSMERREEEKGRREKEMKSKMEGVIKEGNREQRRKKVQ